MTLPRVIKKVFAKIAKITGIAKIENQPTRPLLGISIVSENQW
jgi:hypothetical protein